MRSCSRSRSQFRSTLISTSVIHPSSVRIAHVHLIPLRVEHCIGFPSPSVCLVGPRTQPIARLGPTPKALLFLVNALVKDGQPAIRGWAAVPRRRLLAGTTTRCCYRGTDASSRPDLAETYSTRDGPLGRRLGCLFVGTHGGSSVGRATSEVPCGKCHLRRAGSLPRRTHRRRSPMSTEEWRSQAASGGWAVGGTVRGDG